MKKIFALLLPVAALQAAAASQPLVPGKVNVDFAESSTVDYTYTPAADGVMTFGDMTNISLYTSNVAPAKECYGESFRSTLYIQVRGGVEYTVSVNKGWTSEASSFTFDAYDCPWPDGGSWETAIRPIERMSYVPVTLSEPSYLVYTADGDGVLTMMFNSLVNLKGGTDKEQLADVKTEYQSGGGYRAMIDVEAGKTYYFMATASASYLCSFEVVHPVTGESPDFPYSVGEDAPGIVPAATGTYYYKVANPGHDAYMILQGDAPFRGTAKAGLSFTSFSEESADAIHIRMSVSPAYTDYYMVVTRTEDADADTRFTVSFPDEPTGIFPGLKIDAGTYTTGDFPGLYYYTFTVPADNRKIIKIAAIGDNLDATTAATLYFADNQYSTLATGQSIEFDAQAGRDYAVVWRVAQANVPLSFSLDFIAPAAGESPSNPIIATLGENYGRGGSSAVYFQYTAVVDGRLIITPGAGVPAPAVSMLPIPSDPYTQACEVIEENGSYRVACTAGRGYLLTFFTGDAVSFTLGESGAQQGEAPSTPFDVTDGVAAVPASVGTYWFAFTAPRSGKLEITTNLVFTITENRQDYSFVRLYDPADPDNALTQLRPDYDAHIFAPRVIDTTEGTRYLVKVRTMSATEGVEVKLNVRDAIAGEEPTVPIVIPFNGPEAKYTFDRPVNFEEDALWYSITLPEGLFTLSTVTGGAFELQMFRPSNLTAPIAVTDVIDFTYDEEAVMWIYTYGIADLQIAEAGDYLLKLVDNEAAVEADIKVSGSGAIDEVEMPEGGHLWYDLRGRRLNGAPSAPGLYINNGRKVSVR